MIKKRKWTTEEERVLVDQITRNSHNVKQAFRRTSRLIDRTEAACMYHWYMVVCKRENTSVCFVTIGHNTMNINRKIVHAKTTDNTEVTTVSWWRKIIKLLSHK